MTTKRESARSRGLAWGLYDFANSGYFLVYSLLVFPLYLSKVALAGDPWFAAKWGAAQGGAVLVAVLGGLLLGSRLDRVDAVRLTRVAMVTPAVASFAFPLFVMLHASGNVLIALYVLVHGAYLLSLTIYDASLTRVAERTELAAVSGWAWGLGYMGGLLCMGFMELGLLVWDRYSPADFAMGSAFFLLFAYLAARRLPKLLASASQAKRDESASVMTMSEGDARRSTPREGQWKLLAVFLLIIDGIAIFMAFFAIVASGLAGLEERQITAMLAALQLMAFPLTGLMSALARRGVGRLVLACGVVWATAAGVVVARPGLASMWLAVVLIAAVVGTTQAVVRAVYAATVPATRAVSGFSWYAVVEKGAAFLGPTLAGLLIISVGQRGVMILAGAMVLLGCAMLARLMTRTGLVVTKKPTM